MFFEGKSSQKHLGNIYKFFEICKKRKERIKFILSYLEVKKHHYGWDTMDFNDNVRKDFNYG